jgi:HK97 family phage prohead protease
MPKGLEKYLFGEVEIKAASSKMQMSGYVSTVTADLVDDVVEPEAFRKHLYRYENNPVYCYNHDKMQPIGKVKRVVIDTNGLYLDDITLANIPIVNDVIWPLVKEGVLKQQSIGFLSLDGEMKGKYYHHKEVYLLESSLVTVACNPDASIDTVKGFENYGTLDKLVEAYVNGEFKLPSEVSRQFAINDNPIAKEEKETVNDKTHVLTPDFTDLQPIKLDEKQEEKYDAEGEAVKKPYPTQKHYNDVMSLICLAKDNKGKYLFEVGYPTEKGFAYDWSKVATAMCKIFGAKGGAHFNAEQKAAMIERLASAYTLLGKTVPTVVLEDETEVAVDTLKPEALEEVKYTELNFSEKEPEILMVTILDKDVTNSINLLKTWVDKDIVPEGTVEVLRKSVMAYFDIFGIIDSQGDAELAGQLMALVATYNDRATANVPSAYDDDDDKEAIPAEEKDDSPLPVDEEAIKRLREVFNIFSQ